MMSGNSRHASTMKEQSRRILRDVKGLGAIAADNVGDAADRIKACGRSAVVEGKHTVERA